MKVLIDAPTWFYSKNNTDIRLRLLLSEGLCDQGVTIPNGIIWNLVYNVGFIVVRLFAKLRMPRFSDSLSRFFATVRGYLLRSMNPDVVISQGPNPPVSKSYKLLWETYFLNEGLGAQKDCEFRKGGNNFWIKQMAKFGPLVDGIAVRGRKSVENVKAIYPELSDKVLDLGFVRPEYESVGEEFVRNKQMLNSPIEILFVGREAKRKGLDAVLEACSMLQREGACNFHITVVSDLLNSSDIVIPNAKWVTWYKSLPHSEVMNLMRKAHIFIMPSRFDSYGLVYHEAMANGCVTFARDGEPQKEFVAYGKSGRSVNAYRIPEMAEVLKEVIVSTDMRVSLAVSGLRRYREFYSQNVIRKQWIDAILKMASVI